MNTLGMSCCVVLPDPIRGMRARINSVDTPQFSHVQNLDQRSKMEEVVPNIARGEAQMRDNPEGGEVDLQLMIHALQEEFFRFILQLYKDKIKL